ncbi:hypothetical protein C8F01DRAFT_1264531 [Mycena amicta]|nr:hypothetical protein C8F01DRAFT_1264531 [Mycena amicta]
MPHKLWKRSCGLSRWLTCQNLPSCKESIAISPIAKLPVELLGEIFLSTLADWSPMTEEPSKLHVEPLTLSHVCAHWRAIALSLPMLWSTLWIDRPRAAHVPMVALWLERSHSFPLSIHLRQTDHKICLSYPTAAEHQFTEEIFTLLVPHFPRWQTAELLFKSGPQEALAALPLSDESMLENVSLDVDSWDPCSADALQAALFSRPSLRSITFLPGSQPHTVPWASLTYLVTNGPECTTDTVLGILGASSALTTAGFTLSDQPDWAAPFVPPIDTPVVLPAIKSLALKGNRISLAPLLNRLVLPSLESLSLEYAYVIPSRVGTEEDEDVAALRSLLVRSACAQNLTLFTLREFSRTPKTTEERHIAFLRVLAAQTTALEALELETHLSDRIVEFIAIGPESEEAPSPALPFNNLKHLSLTDVHGEHLTDGLLAAMVLGRTELRAVDLNVRVKSHGDWIVPGLDGIGPEVRFARSGCHCEEEV